MQRECSRILMILAEILVLTDFGVCLLVEHVRVILFERQRSYWSGMLDYCALLKLWDRALLGQLLPHCLPGACLLAVECVCWNVSWAWEWCYNGGLGGGVIGWAAYHACDQSCISSGLLIIDVNKQRIDILVHKCSHLIYRFIAQVAT